MIGRACAGLLLSAIAGCHTPAAIPEHKTQETHTSQNPSASMMTTICAITADPRAFYGKHVTVKGCVTTDGYEHTALFDKSCPNGGIKPSWSSALPPDQQYPLEPGQEACGTFSGTFLESRTVGSVVFDTNVLLIERISNLQILPMSGKHARPE